MHTDSLNDVPLEDELREKWSSPVLAQIRVKVDRELRDLRERPTTEALWMQLVAEGEVLPYADPREIAELVARRRTIKRLHKQVAQEGRAVYRSEDPRYDALGQILSAAMANESAVKAWRQRWLGDLQRQSELFNFLEGLARNEPAWTQHTESSGSFQESFRKTLESAQSDSMRALRRVVRRLVEKYSVLPWQAVRFIVTGKAPIFEPLSVGVRRGPLGHTELVLYIDPRVSRHDVAAFYADARSIASWGKRGETLNVKPLDVKHAKLAEFLFREWSTHDPALGEDARWRLVHQAWNRRYPDWAYPVRRFFKRDAKAAFKRVTGSPWRSDWQPSRARTH